MRGKGGNAWNLRTVKYPSPRCAALSSLKKLRAKTCALSLKCKRTPKQREKKRVTADRALGEDLAGCTAVAKRLEGQG